VIQHQTKTGIRACKHHATLTRIQIIREALIERFTIVYFKINLNQNYILIQTINIISSAQMRKFKEIVLFKDQGDKIDNLIREID
jgi:hypothetical protein